jgi:hypothetical protein
MYITYEFNKWWKYHSATFTWKISQHFESFVVAIIIDQLLQNICITYDHRHVNFVMDTIPFFYLIVLHLSTNIYEC